MTAGELTIRPFVNTDPPIVASLWKRSVRPRGFVHPLSVRVWETEVFSKPFFDRRGFLLAEIDDKVVGFIHAAFGPDEQFRNLDRELGVVAMLAVPTHPDQVTIEDALLAAAEGFLRQQGAHVLYGGQIQPLAPFYFGLYGGSEMPGVLASDQAMNDLFCRSSYHEISRCLLLQRELYGFRPPLDRQLMQNRRQFHVEAEFNPAPATWWQACLWSNIDRTRFRLYPRQGGPPVGSVTYWNMETFSASRGVSSVGLIELEVAPAQRNQRLATFLVAESLRRLHEEGVKLVEVQTMMDNGIARRLYDRLGFVEFNQGIVYRKTESQPVETSHTTAEAAPP